MKPERGLPTTRTPAARCPPATAEVDLRIRKKLELGNNLGARERIQPRTKGKYSSLGRNCGLRILKTGGGSTRTIT